MPILSVAAGIALMLVLLLVVRLDAFFALILTSFAVGLMNGMDPLAVLASITRGIGATMGSVVLVLVFGAMLGKLLEESGAAQAIIQRLSAAFGLRNMADYPAALREMIRALKPGARLVILLLSLPVGSMRWP